MKKYIDNNLGLVFPQPVLFGGVIFIVMGLLVMFEIWYFGILMMVLGLYVVLGMNGARIDVEGRRFKSYSKWLWIRSGQWKSMDPYPYVSVLGKQIGLTLASRGNRTMDVGEITYTVCLLSSTHRTKVIIRAEDTRRAAEKYAVYIAERLGKEVVQYAPEISAQTRERNMRRR